MCSTIGCDSDSSSINVLRNDPVTEGCTNDVELLETASSASESPSSLLKTTGFGSVHVWVGGLEERVRDRLNASEIGHCVHADDFFLFGGLEKTLIVAKKID